MITLTPLFIRWRLSNMNTTIAETFGGLTVRLYVSMTAVRWTISAGQVTTVFRYPVYYDDPAKCCGAGLLITGNVSQVAVRQEALQAAANFIMMHADDELEAKSA